MSPSFFSLWHLRYFVMSPSIVISVERLRFFVMAPSFCCRETKRRKGTNQPPYVPGIHTMGNKIQRTLYRALSTTCHACWRIATCLLSSFNKNRWAVAEKWTIKQPIRYEQSYMLTDPSQYTNFVIDVAFLLPSSSVTIHSVVREKAKLWMLVTRDIQTYETNKAISK